MKPGKILRRAACLFLLIISTAMLALIPANADASRDGLEEPFLTGRKEVAVGTSNYAPVTSTFPFDQSGLLSVGFDALYGTSRQLVQYKGEIPLSLKDSLPYRYSPTDTIDGMKRPWSDGGIDESQITDDSEDPHIAAMTQKAEPVDNWLARAGFGAVNGLHYLTNLALTLVTYVKSIDLAGVIGMFGDGKIAKALSQLFLINTDTGALSPVLVLALFFFVLNLIRLGFAAIKGNMTAGPVMREFAILVTSLFIAGMFFVPTNLLGLSNAGLDFITGLSNDLSQVSIGDDAQIFCYSAAGNAEDTKVTTSNARMNQATQMGLVNKLYIDALISSQLGYGIDDLYLVNADGSEGDFGDLTSLDQAMSQTFGNDADRYSMQVVTGAQNGAKFKTNNLGYWFWAANSSVAIYNGANSRSWDVNTNSDGLQVSRGSSSRILFVVDLLSNLREMHKDDPAMVSKIDTIMHNLVAPNYASAAMSVLLVTLIKIALVASLLWVAIFVLIGQLIIILGSFFLVVMPALMLFSGTRQLAGKMCWTYLFAFIRYLVGSALFNGLIIIVVSLASQGIGGMIVSLISCVAVFKLGPKLLLELNLWISRMSGGKELPQVSRMFMKTVNFGGGNNGRKQSGYFNVNPVSNTNAMSDGRHHNLEQPGETSSTPSSTEDNKHDNESWDEAFGHKNKAENNKNHADNEDADGNSAVGGRSKLHTDNNSQEKDADLKYQDSHQKKNIDIKTNVMDKVDNEEDGASNNAGKLKDAPLVDGSGEAKTKHVVKDVDNQSKTSKRDAVDKYTVGKNPVKQNVMHKNNSQDKKDVDKEADNVVNDQKETFVGEKIIKKQEHSVTKCNSEKSLNPNKEIKVKPVNKNEHDDGIGISKQQGTKQNIVEIPAEKPASKVITSKDGHDAKVDAVRKLNEENSLIIQSMKLIEADPEEEE